MLRNSRVNVTEFNSVAISQEVDSKGLVLRVIQIDLGQSPKLELEDLASISTRSSGHTTIIISSWLSLCQRAKKIVMSKDITITTRDPVTCLLVAKKAPTIDYDLLCKGRRQPKI